MEIVFLFIRPMLLSYSSGENCINIIVSNQQRLHS